MRPRAFAPSTQLSPCYRPGTGLKMAPPFISSPNSSRPLLSLPGNALLEERILGPHSLPPSQTCRLRERAIFLAPAHGDAAPTGAGKVVEGAPGTLHTWGRGRREGTATSGVHCPLHTCLLTRPGQSRSSL